MTLKVLALPTDLASCSWGQVIFGSRFCLQYDHEADGRRSLVCYLEWIITAQEEKNVHFKNVHFIVCGVQFDNFGKSNLSEHRWTII